jgi:hypothetical protein
MTTTVSLEIAKYEQLLTNLQILATLQPFDKLNTTSGSTFYIDNTSYYQGVIRYYYGSSRTHTITALQTLENDLHSFMTSHNFPLLLTILPISNSKHIRTKKLEQRRLRQLIHPSLSRLYTSILSILPTAISGLTNLISTYNGDATTQDAITTIINSFYTLLPMITL